jgi:cytochrome c553
MPKHIVRLLLLIGIFGVVAIGAKFYFTDKSFGVYGHYRADSVAEIAAAAPIYRGAAYCQTCHRERFAQWSAGIHKVVTCETCHGAAGKHPDGKPPVVSDAHTHSLIASARYDQFELSIPADTVKLCTLCHEKMPGRPAVQRQIEVSKHAGTQPCSTCHNPHSPKITVAAVSKTAMVGDVAAGREKAARCVACHGVEGVSSNPAWPNLAGQQRVYLVSTLQTYKTGARRDPIMTDQSKGLSEADANDLAAFYAHLSCQTAGSARPASAVAAGKEKASVCASCHGADGISRNPAWPHLAGQQEGYLVSALKAYRAGARTDALMAGLVKNLSDTDIAQLAAHYAGAKCK